MSEGNLALNTQLQSMGSGFVISGNGLIITNYHVIKGKSKIDVYFPSIDKTFTANIALEDKNNDIALLALENFHISEYFTEDIPFIISNTNNMRLGQEIFTLGYPLGEMLGKSVKLSTGDISSLYGIKDDPRLIQISNPIQLNGMFIIYRLEGKIKDGEQSINETIFSLARLFYPISNTDNNSNNLSNASRVSKDLEKISNC